MSYQPILLDLSPREERVLWEYGFEGKPVKIVAFELGITVETAKSYVKRIRVKLRLKGLPADSRVDLFRAALTECVDLPVCLIARDDLLRTLLDEGAPERLAA